MEWTAFRRDLDVERLSSSISHLRETAAVSVINALMMCWAVGQTGNEGPRISWITAIAALAVLRIVLAQRYQKNESKRHKHVWWASMSSFSAAISGLLWGFAPLWLKAEGSADLWLWGFAIGGMAAAAASVHAAHLATSMVFIVTSCLPLTIMFLEEGSNHSIVGAVLAAGFTAIALRTAVRYSHQYGTSFELRTSLERQAEELERTNESLRTAIEEHRRTEEDLFQARKMDALGKLTGGIAHDFNNLLTVVIGSLDDVSRSPNTHDASQKVSAAMDAALSASALTAQLLTFSRKKPQEQRPTDIVAIVDELRPILLNATARHVDVRFVHDGDLAWAMVDVAQLQSAIINLVINARDASVKGGTINLTIQSQPDDGEAESGLGGLGNVEIVVTDHGRGMDEEEVRRAFEPFFTTKGLGAGTGLGLSQVYAFAQQAGGKAFIRSRVGLGTIVTITLPRVQKMVDESMPPERQSSVSGDGRTMLIVDDNAAICRMLECQFQNRGWKVVVATTCDAAIDRITTGLVPNVIVSDVNMPSGISGIEFAYRIKSRLPDAVLILMSGSDVSSDDLPPGVSFLSKPFTPNRLVKLLDSCVKPSSMVAD